MEAELEESQREQAKMRERMKDLEMENANMKSSFEAKAEQQQQRLTRVQNNLNDAQGFLFAQHNLEQARKRHIQSSEEAFAELMRSMPSYSDADLKAYEMLTSFENSLKETEDLCTSCLSTSTKGRAAYFASAFLSLLRWVSLDEGAA